MASTLNKARFKAGMQCDRRLWRQVHDPLPEDEGDRGENLIGRLLGEEARRLHPDGVLVEETRFAAALACTAALLRAPDVPAIFEAAFTADGVAIRPDILVRAPRGRWILREVKSGKAPDGKSESKDQKRVEEHDEDLALQLHVLRAAGLSIAKVELLRVDGDYVRGKRGIDPKRLFVPIDRTKAIEAVQPEIVTELRRQKRVLSRSKAPAVEPGPHCGKAAGCEFWDACTVRKPDDWIIHLPRITMNGRYDALTARRRVSVRDLTKSELAGLSDSQRRMAEAHRTGKPYVSPDLRAALRDFGPRAYFLDFEAISPALPLYPGTSPFEAIPFQFSLHHVDASGRRTHSEFLADGRNDPRSELVERLLKALGNGSEPIVVYSGYEERVIKGLAKSFPRYRRSLVRLQPRLRDLLKLVQINLYRPKFRFSYSIKTVGPAMSARIAYDDSLAIADGGAAAAAFLDLALGNVTDPAASEALSKHLRRYCAVDTEAMIGIALALV